MHSKNYRDYVIKDGKFIGQFEEMYQNSEEVPWHQDKTAFTLFTEIDLAIIRHYYNKYKFKKACEIGCGYVYITNRLKCEIFDSTVEVSGFDIAQTAIEQARRNFNEIEFTRVDMINDNLSNYSEKFDFLYIKDVLWYVVDNIDIFLYNIKTILNNNGYVYIMNAIPDLKHFYGQDKFPDAFAIIEYFSQHFSVEYANSTYEIDANRVEGAYSKDKYVRLLLKKELKV